MTNRNTRRGKLAFLLIALVVLAVLQPRHAKAHDIKQLRNDAELGDVEAQLVLGGRYRFGVGVPEDHKEAVQWFHLAAELEHAAAQNALGIMYFNGHGVPQNYQEAVK